MDKKEVRRNRDDHKSLSERMNEYQGRVEQRVTEQAERATRELYETPLEQVRDAYGRVLDQFKAEVRKVASLEFTQELLRVFFQAGSGYAACNPGRLERGNHPARSAARYPS